jgi:predicted GNAT family N-acyltransferase
VTIKIELSRDPQLLEQYYTLRERCFRQELELPDFDGSEEHLDRCGHILIAHRDGECVGGARITPSLLPEDQLRDFDLAPETCCAWERFVLDPTIRTVQLARDFLAHLIEVSRVLGYHHALMFSSQINARFYRQCHTALSAAFQIHETRPGCAQGPFDGLEHYLSVSKLREERRSLYLVA